MGQWHNGTTSVRGDEVRSPVKAAPGELFQSPYGQKVPHQ